MKRRKQLMKLWKRCLAFLLFCCLLTQHCFVSAAVNTRSSDVDQTAETEAETEEASILYEIVEKRDAFTKHFQMTDGTIMAATYEEQVHYPENGEYREIEAVLTSATEDGSAVLESGGGTLPVKFANNSGNKLFSIGKGNTKIKVALSNANKVKVQKWEPEGMALETLPDERLAVTTKTGVIYEDILKNVDLAYITGSMEVKENMILKSPDVPESYTFTYTGKDLTYRTLENGDIELYLNGSETAAYTMAAPFMVDAEGKYSEAIEITAELSGKTLRITLTPSREFLEAEDTVYPVLIDPPIETPDDYRAIQDTYVCSGRPNSNNVGSHGSMLVGKNGDYGTCHAYLKFHSLPQLSAGDVIVKAYISIWQYDFSANNGQPFYIAAYENQSDWDESITWYTKPASLEAVDYMKAESCMVNGTAYCVPKTLDVTKLARDWYAGRNYGVMLASIEDRYADARFYTSDHPEISSDLYPSGYFIYRNTNGIEDYWSYHSASTALGTTGLVNDATGALSIVNTDYSESGSNMPFALTRTYNINNLYTEPSRGIRTGIGWTTNLNQYLYWVEAANVRYCVYVDADGTAHYIRNVEGTEWYDEDGLGYKLDYNDANGDYCITDKNGSKVRLRRVSDGNIYPYAFENSNGVRIEINYENEDYGKPVSVTDGAGRITELFYNETGRVAKIKDPSGRETVYRYDGNGEYLGRITYPDEQFTEFGYIIGLPEKRVTVSESDGSGLQYETNAANRVVSAEELGTDGSRRRLYDVSYPAVNVMRYTYADGLTEDYQSDDFGRVTTITNSEGYGVYTGFTTGNGSVKANHKTTFVSNVQKSVANLVINGGAEILESYWDHEGWGNDADVSAGKSTDAKLGNYSWQVTKENTAGYYHKRSSFEVEKGKTYTLSGYIKTTLTESSDEGGAKLYAVYHDENGNQCREYSDAVTDTKGEWERVSLTFTTTQSTGIIYLFAGITEGAAGTALFDCIQLEEGEVANRYNAVENGSFERGFTNVEVGGNTSLVSGNVPVGGAGCAVMLVGNTYEVSTYAKIYTDLNVPSDTSLVVGAYGKASAAPKREETENGSENPRRFGLEVTAYYTDNTTYTQVLEFNDALSSATWQYLSGAVNLSYQGDRNISKTVSHVTVAGIYDCQVNGAWFDLFSIYVEEFGSEYAYDADGNLVSAEDVANQANTYVYGDDNLKRLISPTGTDYEYGYDEKKNLTDSTGAEGIRNIIKYDNFGNPTYTLTQGEARNKSLQVYQESEEHPVMYYIRNAKTGKYLEVLNQATDPGSPAGQYTLNQTSYQMWRLKKNRDGSYSLHPNSSPTRYLATDQASAEEGKVMVLSSEADASTSYRLERTGNGTYNIRLHADKEKVVEIPAGYGDNNRTATVGTLENKGGGALDQQWYFEVVHETDEANPEVDYHSEEPENEAVYYIKSVYNGRYLNCNITEEGATIRQNIFTGGTEQKFLIKRSGNGLRIIPVKLEKEGKEIAPGARESEIILSNGTTANGGYYFTISSAGNGAHTIFSATDGTLFIRMPENASTFENAVPVIGSNSSSARSWWVFEKAGSYMESSATYTEDGNYLKEVTSSDGTTVSYLYDEDEDGNIKKGLVTSVTEPSSVTATNTTSTGYTYNADNDQLESVTKGESQVLYVYSNRKLQEITSPSGTKYRFAYNAYHQTSGVSVGNRSLSQTGYDSLERVNELTYGNGTVVQHVYDSLSRITSVKYNNEEKISYLYDNDGNVKRMTDRFGAAPVTTTYEYDSVKRLVSLLTSEGFCLRLRYDDKNRVSKVMESIAGTGILDKVTEYTYHELGMIVSTETTQGGIGIRNSYSYDDLYRISESTIRIGSQTENEDGSTGTRTTEVLSNRYKYADGAKAGSITNRIIQHVVKDRTYDYSYDLRGNITHIILNGSVIAEYVYDEFDQLIKETANGVVTEWTYDKGGNILTRSQNGTIIEYTYGDAEWKDLLTSYNGKTITYDAIGNPTSIGTDTSLTWEAGRRLSSMTKAGVTTSFTYNADGYRTSKTTNGVTTRYYLDGSRISAMKAGGEELSFVYDENGIVVGLYHNGTPYVYAKNLQGDIIGIIDGNGNWVVSYSYDAWGNPISTEGSLAGTVGSLNPFRYRGYYYDAETGFYYVSSRYYDPEIGRFINADDTIYLGADSTLLSYNLFTYCKNNPIMYSDHNGHAPEWWQWAISGAMVVAGVTLVATGVGGIAGGALICAGTNSMIGSYISEATGGSSAAGWVGGMITGAACGTGAGLAGNLFVQATNATGAVCLGNLAAGGAVAFGSGTIGSVIGQGVSAAIDGKKLNSKRVVYAATVTGAINCLSGLGAGIGTALQGMPTISTTTTTLANSLNAALSLVSESVCDFLGTISSLLPW